ncbi:hypothetical protein ISCGN_027582 [Ixodes scapularis]
MTSSNPVYIVVQILASLTISWTGPSSYPRAFTAPSAITQGAFFNLTRSGGGTFNVSAEWPQLVLVPFAQAAASTSSFMDGFPTRPGSTYSSVSGHGNSRRMTSSNPVYIVVQILASLTISWTGPSSYPRAFTAPSAITQGAFFNLTRSGGGTFNVSAEWPQLVLVPFAQAAASTSSFMDGFPTRPGSTYSSVSGHGNSRRMTSSNPVYIVVQILASLTISWTGPSSYPRAFTAPSAITQGAFFNLTRSGGGTFNVSAEWPQLVLVPFAQAAASTSSFMDGFPTRPGSTYSSVSGHGNSRRMTSSNPVYIVVQSAAKISRETWVALDSERGAGPLRTTSAKLPFDKKENRFLASGVQTYPGLGSTTRMPFSPDTGKPRTARRGQANPHGSGSVETPLSKHLLSQVPPAGDLTTVFPKRWICPMQQGQILCLPWQVEVVLSDRQIPRGPPPPAGKWKEWVPHCCEREWCLSPLEASGKDDEASSWHVEVLAGPPGSGNPQEPRWGLGAGGAPKVSRTVRVPTDALSGGAAPLAAAST